MFRITSLAQSDDSQFEGVFKSTNSTLEDEENQAQYDQTLEAFKNLKFSWELYEATNRSIVFSINFYGNKNQFFRSMDLNDHEMDVIRKNPRFEKISRISIKDDLKLLKEELYDEQDESLTQILGLEKRSVILDEELKKIQFLTDKFDADIKSKIASLQEINKNVEGVSSQKKNVENTNNNYLRLKEELEGRIKIQNGD